MASQDKGPKSASKNIEEFLQRHPEVGRHASGHAELENVHRRDDTFCLVLKLFDNAILHREYDQDSMKLVYAHVYVDEEQAMSSIGNESKSFLCGCEVGTQEGMDHHLHEFMRVVEADCKVHGEGEFDFGCKNCRALWFGSNCRGVKGCDRGWLWGMGVSEVRHAREVPVDKI
ncbi:hypothetical protein FMUND_7751 [Fusarium mundagurra]|uniref:Uncharacterized protein n=1 Tax=Fusarium mundagurra TaxID=1567541 RepID=A0A8H6DG76_9HYPO|nr:hypothetical protein FMUND_7751 [Fusarium mundagurra]